MTLAEAVQKLGLAGRELGSGPARAAELISPNADSLRTLGFAGENALAANIGISLQLLMSEDPDALRQLHKIHEQWRRKP